MRVVIIGSGGPIVTKERVCAGVLIDDDILIDCGSGVLKNLRELNVDLTAIRQVMISHTHADHICDLVPLLWAMELDGRREPLEIAGYQGIQQVTQKLKSLMHTSEVLTYFELKFRSLTGSESFNNIQTLQTIHEPNNLAYRINRGGKSLCYTGDTAFYEPLAQFASECNMMIHDTLFLDEQKEIAMLTNHSTAGEAGRIAQMAKVEKLVLFHLFPNNRAYEDEFIKQASREFSGEVIIARDLLKLEI